VIAELKEQLAACKREAEARRKRLVAVEARRDSLLAQVGLLQDELTELASSSQTIAEQRIRIRALQRRINDVKAKIAALATDVADD
jgi:chromosome segregation ATPase